jgi:membrane-associated protease RseP (regulator of RpoE activity)
MDSLPNGHVLIERTSTKLFNTVKLHQVMDIDTIISFVFFGSLALGLYLNREKVLVQKVLSIGKLPLIYAVLYRTTWGLAWMDNSAKNYPRLFRFLGIAGIYIGFLGMIAIVASLAHNFYSLLTIPDTPAGVQLVLPFKAPGAIHVPILYWLISIFFIAIVHEFAHGVIARAFNIPVKSSGFAFLSLLVPLIPAAFVEPDEKKLQKASLKEQLAVYAAGPFSNVIFGSLFLALLAFVMFPAGDALMLEDGVRVSIAHDGTPAAQAGIVPGLLITSIQGVPIVNVSDFILAMEKTTIGQSLMILGKVGEEHKEFQVTLSAHPSNDSKAYLGVSVNQVTKYRPEMQEKYGDFALSAFMWLIPLVYWLTILNFGIGLFNLVPLGPIDGGRMIYAVLLSRMDKERALVWFKYISLVFLALILIPLMMGFLPI